MIMVDSFVIDSFMDALDELCNGGSIEADDRAYDE